jgi:peptidoglycan/xylan/chitin deacetylase (PgdA/CDA1 family)
MSARSVLKAVAGPALRTKAARRLLRGRYGGIGAVFALHRVSPAGGRPTCSLEQNRSLELTGEQLARLIEWVRSQGYRIATLDEMADRLEARTRASERLCVFTFDDGYKDNLTEALPIFERYGAPMSVFVTTDFPDRRIIMWWYAVEHALMRSSVLDLRFAGAAIRCSADSMPEKNAAFEAVRTRLSSAPREAVIAALSSIGVSQAELSDLTDTMALSWDDVRTLAAHPLVTIGAHSASHRTLSALDAAAMESEIAGSKRRIEEEIGRTVEFFCYPFGDPESCGEREFAAAGRAGFRAAMTTRVGNIVPAHRAFPQVLPRIPIDGDPFSIDSIDQALSGYLRLRRGHLSNLVVD